MWLLVGIWHDEPPAKQEARSMAAAAGGEWTGVEPELRVSCVSPALDRVQVSFIQPLFPTQFL